VLGLSPRYPDYLIGTNLKRRHAMAERDEDPDDELIADRNGDDVEGLQDEDDEDVDEEDED
jgi:hypothetical protein